MKDSDFNPTPSFAFPPDVDVDDLPAPAELAGAVQLENAGRILRAVLKAEETTEKLKAQMKADQYAWAKMIARNEARTEAIREMIRSWMLRTNTTKIQSPWLTASIGKGRTRLVVDDEAAAILHAENLGAHACVKKSLVNSEFATVYNSRPDLFQDIAHEETGEPTLIIRKREQP